VANPAVFRDDETAIVTLGLGKNMVRSIRFWGEAFGLLRADADGVRVTELAKAILDPQRGHDPYIESSSTLWKLHWQLCAHAGLGAWVIAFQEVVDPEIAKDRLVELVRAKASGVRGDITAGTAAAHVDILLRTYDAARMETDGALAEALGCPLQELELLTVMELSNQQTIRFPRKGRPDLDSAALAFALHDIWRSSGQSVKSLSFRSLMLERRSPGAIFKLDESSLYSALEDLCEPKDLDLQEDGAGGVSLVATGKRGFDVLEDIAWATH
jgi:hypothetical protein